MKVNVAMLLQSVPIIQPAHHYSKRQVYIIEYSLYIYLWSCKYSKTNIDTILIV